MLRILLEEPISFGLHGYLFCTVVACVVQKRYWLPEANEKGHLSVVLLTFDIAYSLADVVQILRGFDDVFDKIGSFKEIIPAPLLPEVEEIVLEEFHVPHQLDVLSLDLCHFFVKDLRIGFLGLFELKIENLDVELDVIDGLLAYELVLLDPLLKFRDVVGLDMGFRRKFLQIVVVLYCQNYVSGLVCALAMVFLFGHFLLSVDVVNGSFSSLHTVFILILTRISTVENPSKRVVISTVVIHSLIRILTDILIGILNMAVQIFTESSPRTCIIYGRGNDLGFMELDILCLHFLLCEYSQTNGKWLHFK